MAGTIVCNTLNTDTGLFSTNNAYTGIAKAWVNFQGGGGNTAGTINGSFNVSSITVNSTGYYTVNFSTALSNSTYSVSGNASANTSSTQQYLVFQPFSNPATGTTISPTTSSFVCSTGSYTVGVIAPTYVNIVVLD